MFDHRFLVSKTGIAALISVAAMVVFNVYAASQQFGLDHVGPDLMLVATPMVGLA
ncbi:hypothetical protein [Alteraurantiacibacter aquimixticola]|uniref:hypothetical protein n=1 Tax=Alteraurantiacibacter aquimixticola TaxID=2489173 RepID=UPI00145AF691|nr:hypothetical protein [Alteraurantiacibacter aquimixticola]